jgi:hypothetical protein
MMTAKTVMYDAERQKLFLPASFWTDGDSFRCAFMARLAFVIKAEICLADAPDFKILTSADDTEEFWKGMLLSLTEKNPRRLKKRDKPAENGIVQGISLMASGFIIRKFGEGALIKNQTFLRNEVVQ